MGISEARKSLARSRAGIPGFDQLRRCLNGELITIFESPYAKNTIIVLWSDHGWHLEKSTIGTSSRSGKKPPAFPLIEVAPNITSPGTKTSRPVGLVDLYPTLAELCGLSPPKNLDGISLVPLLRDPSRQWERPLAHHAWPGQPCSQNRTVLRYIRYADGSEELYDHAADPHEWKNIANQSKVKELKQQLQKWFPETNAKPAPSTNAFRFGSHPVSLDAKTECVKVNDLPNESAGVIGLALSNQGCKFQGVIRQHRVNPHVDRVLPVVREISTHG